MGCLPVDTPFILRSSNNGDGDVKHDLDSIPQLASRPESSSILYLDFNGNTYTGSSWKNNVNPGEPIVTPVYSRDNDFTTFTTTELEDIEEVWKRVSENFRPWDINVTTIDPGDDVMKQSRKQRVCIGGSCRDWYKKPEDSGAGGVAKFNSFSGSIDRPCFTFIKNLGGSNMNFASCTSHEFGHTINLRHQEVWENGQKVKDYRGGTGSGEMSVGPIMGSAYRKNSDLWSYGTSGGQEKFQDDIAKINQSLTYLDDDHGDDIANATDIGTAVDNLKSGLVSTTEDVDVFLVEAQPGPLFIKASPFQPGPNLDVKLKLMDSQGNTLSEAEPANQLSATINASVVTRSSYYISVTSNGTYGRIGTYDLYIDGSEPTLPVIKTHPVGTTFAKGGSFTLSVDVLVDLGNLAYQWYLNGNPLTGSNAFASSITVSSADHRAAGAYHVVVSSDGGNVTSNEAIVDYTGVPRALGRLPSKQYAVLGKAFSMRGYATGTAPYSITWFKDKKTTGVTGHSYTVETITAEDAGSYHYEVSNELGTAKSPRTTLIVLEPPAIVEFPEGSVVGSKGDTLEINPTVTGSKVLRFQWQKHSKDTGNWLDMEDASKQRLRFTKAGYDVYGHYRLKVFNPNILQEKEGTVLSPPTTLMIQTKPWVETASTSLLVGVGDPATLSFVALGSEPLSYQWYKVVNKKPVEAQGATGASLNIQSTTADDAGKYYIEVTNPAGMAQSAQHSLTVHEKPAFTASPIDVTALAGSTVEFRATCTGTAKLSYQWHKDGNPYGKPTSKPSLRISKVTDEHVGNYSVTATNAVASATSATASLTVNYAPALTGGLPSSLTIMEGQSLNLEPAFTGTTPITHTWSMGKTSFDSSDTSQLSVNALTDNEAGTYKLTSTNAGGTVVHQVKVFVTLKPVVIKQPGGTSVKTGATVKLKATVSGSPPLTYQWHKDGEPLDKPTKGPELRMSKVAASKSGSYELEVSNPAGSVMSDAVEVVVHYAPILTKIPESAKVAAGSDHTIEAEADGLDALGANVFTWKWFKDGKTLSGAVTNELTLTQSTTAQSGKYHLEVSNKAGKTLTKAVNIEVIAPPVPGKQPVGVTTYAGAKASLSGKATGTDLSYQWYKLDAEGNGQPIDGAGDYKLTFEPAGGEHNGDYYVVASNIAGSVTSDTVNVTVYTLPSFQETPSGITLEQGDNASLPATVDGLDLELAWLKDESPLARHEVVNAISNPTASTTLNLTNVTTEDNGIYTIKASNFATINLDKPILSEPVVIAVTLPENPGQAIQGNTILLGDPTKTLHGALGSSVKIDVTVTSVPEGTRYIWQKLSEDGIWTDQKKLTQPVMEIKRAAYADSGYYRLRGYQGEDESFTTACAVSILPATWVDQQPNDSTGLEGHSHTITSGIQGPTPITLQWYSLGEDGSSTLLQGKTDSSLNFASLAPGDAGTYFMAATTPVGTIITDTADLDVVAKPTITSQPTNMSAVFGSALNLEVTGEGPKIVYQWEKKDGKDWVAAAKSSTKSYLKLSRVYNQDAGTYRVTLNNSAGSVTSNTLELTVNNPPAISSFPPASVTLNEGADHTFSFGVNGTGPIHFSWRKDGKDWEDGLDGDSHSFNSITTQDAAEYTFTATNSLGATSRKFEIVVIEKPRIKDQPKNVITTMGKSFKLSAKATGTGPLSYQWLKDGQPHGKATKEARLDISKADLDDAGSYALRITNSAGVVNSQAVLVTVQYAPLTTPLPKEAEAAVGGRHTLTATAVSLDSSGQDTHTYQWFKDGRKLDGGTEHQFNLTDLTATDSGKYYFEARNAVGKIKSNTLELEVLEPPALTRQPSDLNAIEGHSGGLSCKVTGSNIAYQWFRNDVAVQGANLSSLKFKSIQSSDAGSYHMEASNFAGTVVSETVTLTLYELPVVTSTDSGQSLLNGDSAIISASASGNGISYLWHKDGMAIQSSNTPQLALDNATPLDNGVYRLQFINTATVMLETEIFSTPIVITVNDPPTILNQPTDEILADGTATLSVSATGSGTLVYQWHRDNNVEGGATSSTFIAGTTGSYFVTITSNHGTVTSDTVTVTDANGNGDIFIDSPEPGPVPQPRPDFPGLPGYEVWASVLPVNASGTHEDADDDGRLNLLEYAMGTDPLKMDPGTPLTQSHVGGHGSGTLLLSYIQSKSATDVRFSVESSLDLRTWEPATIESTSRIDKGDNTEVVLQVGMVEPGGFFRLVIEEL